MININEIPNNDHISSNSFYEEESDNATTENIISKIDIESLDKKNVNNDLSNEIVKIRFCLH